MESYGRSWRRRQKPVREGAGEGGLPHPALIAGDDKERLTVRLNQRGDLANEFRRVFLAPPKDVGAERKGETFVVGGSNGSQGMLVDRSPCLRIQSRGEDFAGRGLHERLVGGGVLPHFPSPVGKGAPRDKPGDPGSKALKKLL